MLLAGAVRAMVPVMSGLLSARAVPLQGFSR
jgi:hypothetical protein